jgi:hypothetical protein
MLDSVRCAYANAARVIASNHDLEQVITYNSKQIQLDRLV